MNCYEIIGIFLIAPLWGTLSPRLFLKGWLSFLGIVATVIFLFQARKQFISFLLLVCSHVTDMLFSFTLLFAGFYILYFYFPFGHTNAEFLIYWIFSMVQLAFILPAVSIRIDQLLEQAKGLSSPSE